MTINFFNPAPPPLPSQNVTYYLNGSLTLQLTANPLISCSLKDFIVLKHLKDFFRMGNVQNFTKHVTNANDRGPPWLPLRAFQLRPLEEDSRRSVLDRGTSRRCRIPSSPFATTQNIPENVLNVNCVSSRDNSTKEFSSWKNTKFAFNYFKVGLTIVLLWSI